MNKKIEILKKAYRKEKDVKILKRILMVLYTLKKRDDKRCWKKIKL